MAYRRSSTRRNLEMTDWVLQSDLTSPYLLQQLLFFSPAGYTEKGGQEGRIQPVALSAVCYTSIIRTVSPRSESAQRQQKYDRNWQWEQPISFQFCFLPTPGWVDCFLNEWEKAQVNLTWLIPSLVVMKLLNWTIFHTRLVNSGLNELFRWQSQSPSHPITQS